MVRPPFIDNVNNDERETQTLTRQITRNPVKELLIDNEAPSDEEINEYEDNVSHENVGEDTDSVNYACKHCDKKYPTAGNLKRHIQSKHEGVKYPCNQCDYQATDKSHLKTHVEYKHEGVKYACNQCDYQATTPRSLTIKFLEF